MKPDEDASRPSRAADFLALAKPRLNALVIFTAAVGFWLGARRPLDAVHFFHAVAGTALVAGGAAAFNQVLERERDAQMHRTRTRPVPEGRLGLGEAIWFGALLTGAGLMQLALGANALASGIAFLTLVIYAAVYTPLKSRTSLSTVVGAIPGALPPMIGWAAATHTVSREAWALFALVFVWQMPHFLAIAWLFKDDYARAGFPMLPVIETDGRRTAYQVSTYASALLPVSLLPTLIGLTGRVYFVAALVLGLGLLGISFRFARRRDKASARNLFYASIAYLPLVLLIMMFDRLG